MNTHLRLLESIQLLPNSNLQLWRQLLERGVPIGFTIVLGFPEGGEHFDGFGEDEDTGLFEILYLRAVFEPGV